MPIAPATPRAFALLRRALLSYLLYVILVITLLPFRFQWPTTPHLFWGLKPFDMLTNAGLFLPLGFLLQLTRRQGIDRWGWRAAAWGTTLSLGIELTQLLLPGRYSSPVDVLANGLGCWLGALLYSGIQRHLHQRLVGQLALELPLMNLFYLLVPLLWLTSLAAGADASRLWLTPLLGLCGVYIVVTVWAHRLHPARALPAALLSLLTALWFLIGVLPGLARRPGFLLLCSLGIALATRLLALVPPAGHTGERRFELPTLRRLWPLYGLYLGLMALWPWPWWPHAWQGSLGFAEIARVPGVLAVLRVLEYLAAFTLLGYMLAETRGRRPDPLWDTIRWVLTWGLGIAGGLESLRGWHPQHVASLANMVLASGAALYGGLVYRLQRVVVQHLLRSSSAPATPAFREHRP